MNKEKITIALTIEQILSVQAAIIARQNSLRRDLDHLRGVNAPEDCIQFTEQEIQELEAAMADIKEAIKCTP